MSTRDRQRCFECGISYPPDAHECEEDHVPLWPGTIAAVWRIEGVIANRPGGAICAAYHLHTGERVAIDVVRRSNPVLAEREGMGAAATADAVSPILTQPEPSEPSYVDPSVRMLQAEAQALRVLDQPSLLRLLESGVDEGDIHYLVSELGTARPLRDLIEEWQRAGSWPLSGRATAQIGAQLLGALAAAHRVGITHSGMSFQHIFLDHDEEVLAGRARPGAVRLRGLRVVDLAHTLRRSVQSDLRALSIILFELLAGEPPPRDVEETRSRTIPIGVDPALWEVITGGLAPRGRDHFSTADDMLRALTAAQPAASTEASAAAIGASGRTDPGAGHSSTEEIPVVPPSDDDGEWTEGKPGGDGSAGQGADPLPPPRVELPPEMLPAPPPEARSQPNRFLRSSRMSGPHMSLPAPPGVVAAELPLASTISGELKQVSFRDLIKSEHGPRRQETLAQSRRRVSATSLKMPVLAPPPEFLVAPPPMNSHPMIPSQPLHGSSGEHSMVEPTADLSALPIGDYASQISAGDSASLPPVESPFADLSPPPAGGAAVAKPSVLAPALALVSGGPAVRSGSSVPEPIDPFAATGQAVGAGASAGRGAQTLLPPGAIMLPPQVAVAVARPSQASADTALSAARGDPASARSGAGDSAGDVSRPPSARSGDATAPAKASGDALKGPAPISGGAEPAHPDEHHARTMRYAIVAAVLLVLLALWLLLH